MKNRLFAVCFLFVASLSAQTAQPVVAIHVSELTQALANAPASGATPTGVGTTGNQWWTPWWQYSVMEESLKEAFRSDGTPTVVVSDADISSGKLLTSGGLPQYPIVISLASEAIQDSEIAQLVSYVNAGGFLFMGSSAFTRNPDGTTRGDFALASEIGLHMTKANLQDWSKNSTFSNVTAHRLVSHIPNGTLFWQMPLTSEDISWGTSPHPLTQPEIETYHYVWQTTATNATVIASADNGIPYLTVTPYGKGYFIYDAAMQPIMGFGGFSPGMYAYGIFRNAVEWAFQNNNLPIIKLSPWPYPYNAAYAVRHDFEDYQSNINAIESSAQAEHSVGALGDYYFCTGTLRVEMNNSPATIASLQRAVSLYGATVSSHNGGLRNPNNPGLISSNYDYWHWGPDEALDDTPAGYANGSSYASASISQSFSDIDGWLSGVESSRRNWVAPYFNGTRDGSMKILQQLGVTTAGEQKVSPFPHWTVSTQTPGTRFSFVTLPVSDWYLGTNVSQAMEDGFTDSTVDALVDYYYGLGALINLYSHNPSTSDPVSEYVLHASSKPAIWPVNATTVYQWWNKRSLVQMTPSYSVAGSAFLATATIAGATDPNTAIELVIPNWAMVSNNIQVKLNGAIANPGSYRTYNNGIKINVGTTVTNVQVSYSLAPVAQNDSYSVRSGASLAVTAPGVLANDSGPTGSTLTAVLVTGPLHGSLTLNPDGSFSYTPVSSFTGTDSFTYEASAAGVLSAPATATIAVSPLSVSTVTLNPTTVVSGTNSTGTVTLNATAPSGGTVVNLASGNTAIATVPSSVTVPAGSTSTTFSVTSGTVSASANVNITATFAGTSQSATLTVQPTSGTGAVLFSDSFSGTNGPDPLWTTVQGTWNVSNGVMTGTSATNNYAYTYVNATWTDYTVQGQVQFPAGAYGGGIGGRVNSSTGAHYGVWVYPEGSAGGSSVIKLVKFSNWTTWGGTPMVQVNLPSVGTSLHTLAVTFAGNVIQVSYDGVQYINVTDSGFGSLPALTTGGISLDMWNSSTAYIMNIDNILVQAALPIVLAQNDAFNTTQAGVLNVSAPGVLANDTASSGSSGLTAILSASPAHGTITLQSDGSFSYTPASNFSGTDSFTYRASAAGVLSNIATGTITVSPLSVSSVTLNPTAVVSGATSTGTVTLNAAAPSGGTLVSINSSNTAAATVPASVTVPSGSNSASFAVTSKTVTASTAVSITATFAGTSQSATLTVSPLSVSTVALNPTTVVSGTNSTGTVTLNAAAPSGGTVVTLTSSNSAVATVPATVSIPSGSTSTTFSVTVGAVTTSTAVNITASFASSNQTANLTVEPTIGTSTVLFSDTFSSANSLANWTTFEGTFAINSGVLSITADSTSWGYLSAPGSWSDYSVSVDLATNMYINGAGLVVRFDGSTQYYILWLYYEGRSWSSDARMILQRVNGGNVATLSSIAVPALGSTNHTLKIVCNGPNLQGYLDGTKYTDITDASPFLNGGAGIIMAAPNGNTVLADNFVIASL